MAVTELDPIDGPVRDSRSPVTIINAITAAMAVPTNVTDGIVVGRSGVVRFYFAFGGTVTALAGTIWLRNRQSGLWHRALALSDLKTFSNFVTTSGEYADVQLSPGDEFYLQITTLSGTTPSLTVYAAQSFAISPLILGRQSLIVDTELPSITALSDAMAIGASPAVLAANAKFDGTNWYRDRANESRTIFTSAARTAPPALTDLINFATRTLIVYVKATVMTGLGVSFVIEGKDPVGLDYWPILTSAALTAPTGAGAPLILRVSPDLAASAGLIAQTQVPRLWRVRPVHGDGANVTYSVGADLLV